MVRTMKEIGAFEAKNRLGTLLDWVECGEEVVITRRGKPVARLLPSRPAANPDEAREAARKIRAMSRGMSLGGLAIKDLVAEGRL